MIVDSIQRANEPPLMVVPFNRRPFQINADIDVAPVASAHSPFVRGIHRVRAVAVAGKHGHLVVAPRGGSDRAVDKVPRLQPAPGYLFGVRNENG
jgi:hypothetical protein